MIAHGTYRAFDENRRLTLKHYKQKFLVPEIVSYKQGRKFTEQFRDGRKIRVSVPNIVTSNFERCKLHVIRKYFVIPWLKETYPESSGVQLCSISSCRPVLVDPSALPNIQKPIAEMSYQELITFCVINDLDTNLESFSDLSEKKMAVELQWESKKKEQNQKPVSQEEDLLKPLSNKTPEKMKVEETKIETKIETEDLEDEVKSLM